ncbi:MAG TPA: FAD-dependent tricarballylate dehydrogenase TcuA [Stellaceae bacterium]|nr:FAD-dependent tricarballylate dehydrogenase TcuA [Stellaceae bacterium]
MAELTCDVVVVGAGNAALSAALSAREQGASVVVLERAPEAECGGNSRFTAGAIRTVYNGVEDLKKLIPDLTEAEIARTDYGAYTREQFYDDLGRITQYRSDPDLAEILIERSLETLVWLRGKGVKFLPAYGRQAFKIGDKTRFWGGLTVEATGGGPGLVAAEHEAARRNGIAIHYRTRALSLLLDERRVIGVHVRQGERSFDIAAKSVVLASGGFQANAEWRTRYLGPGWDLAKVRGTRFNTGDGIRMALDAGAMPWGNWSGCHAVAWDRNAPEFGDLAVGDNFQKHSYPFGIVVNTTGRRFLDEGADFRNYTYAKYGRAVLEQPAQTAWQVFDGKVLHLLREEYRIRQVTKARADSIEALAQKLEGIDRAAFIAEVAAFNRAVRQDVPFDPTVKDGRRAEGLPVPKSNWANTLDTPPFEAYQVTCGITFTFGGLRIDAAGRVIDTEGEPIPGLFAAGELVGGLFYFNYPGGTGLLSGAVFGRIAGASAGKATAIAV